MQAAVSGIYGANRAPSCLPFLTSGPSEKASKCLQCRRADALYNRDDDRGYKETGSSK